MNPTSVCLRLALTGAGIASYFPALRDGAAVAAVSSIVMTTAAHASCLSRAQNCPPLSVSSCCPGLACTLVTDEFVCR